jgi:hypothetical protein
MNEPEMKNCGEGCGCAVEKETQLKAEQKNLKIAEVKKAEEKLDPTHFGDWQINCRAIDF